MNAYLTTKEDSIRFIGKFLCWYQNSFSLPDVVNQIELEKLVTIAESIHTKRVKEIDKTLSKPKAKRFKRISRFL